MGDQIVLAGPSLQVQTDHFKRTFGGVSPRPKPNQQQCHQGDIDLKGQAGAGSAQPVSAAQNALKPPEKQLYLPAIGFDSSSIGIM